MSDSPIEIILNKIMLNNFELKNHEYLVDSTYYDDPCGKQEYRLYSYLSTFFQDSVILDIGTLCGRSAIALSHNESNKVISYNIRNQIPKNHKIYEKKNIEFRIGNVLHDLKPELISKAKIVMIDIDHYGHTEEKIIQQLEQSGFSGLIILDDIDHPRADMKEAMKKLWKNIKLKKYDVTEFGHESGTGLILMNTKINIKLLED